MFLEQRNPYHCQSHVIEGGMASILDEMVLVRDDSPSLLNQVFRLLHDGLGGVGRECDQK